MRIRQPTISWEILHVVSRSLRACRLALVRKIFLFENVAADSRSDSFAGEHHGRDPVSRWKAPGSGFTWFIFGSPKELARHTSSSRCLEKSVSVDSVADNGSMRYRSTYSFFFRRAAPSHLFEASRESPGTPTFVLEKFTLRTRQSRPEESEMDFCSLRVASGQPASGFSFQLQRDFENLYTDRNVGKSANLLTYSLEEISGRVSRLFSLPQIVENTYVTQKWRREESDENRKMVFKLLGRTIARRSSFNAPMKSLCSVQVESTC